ncbi:MAG TPA: DUF4328 domain-containing protein [Symbiobacteriaceae bacterium]|nr:DUF4328 domain-containing protein [Symbiobacteriaceae bacterium]
MSRLFEPNESVTRWTAGLNRTVAVLSIPMLFFRLIQASSGDASAVKGAADGLNSLIGLVGLVGAVLVLVWTYQAYSNLEPLGNYEPTLATGWAVAGWLIPIASLVLPYLTLRELWQSSDHDLAPGDKEGRRAVPIPTSIYVWWATNLIPALFALFTLSRIAFLTRAELIFGPGQRWLLWAVALNTAASIAESFLFAEIITEIQERQVARWHRLEARRHAGND